MKVHRNNFYMVSFVATAGVGHYILGLSETNGWLMSIALLLAFILFELVMLPERMKNSRE
jgi:hypothetical protein